jgi:hypothetical protein
LALVLDGDEVERVVAALNGALGNEADAPTAMRNTMTSSGRVSL